MNIGTIRSYGAARTKAAGDEDFNTLREVHMSDELYFGKEGAEIPDTEHLFEPETEIIDSVKERQFAEAPAGNKSENKNSEYNSYDSVISAPETAAAASVLSLPKYLAAQVGKQVRVEFSANGLQSRSGRLQAAGTDYIAIKQPDGAVAVCEISGVKIVTISE